MIWIHHVSMCIKDEPHVHIDEYTWSLAINVFIKMLKMLGGVIIV